MNHDTSKDNNNIIIIIIIITPIPPTKSFPTKSSWVKLSGRLPIKLMDMRIPTLQN